MQNPPRGNSNPANPSASSANLSSSASGSHRTTGSGNPNATGSFNISGLERRQAGQRHGESSTTVNVVNAAIGHVRIGDLLMGAGIVSDEFIHTTLASFEDRGMPLGKILTISGYLSELQLRRALEIQALVNERQLPIEVALTVLALAHAENLSLPEAFAKSEVVQPEDQMSNKLGQLLTGAGVATQNELDDALGVSQASGLPLGHIFCYRGLLSQQLLETALLGQQLIRRGSLSRENCIAAVARAHGRELALEQLPFNAGFQRLMTRSTPRLGELVFEGEFIADSDLITALQLSLSSGIPVGAAMISCANLRPEIVLTCVEMQEMIDNELLDSQLAYDTLFRIREFGYSFERALAEACTHGTLKNQTARLVELLSLAGQLRCPVAALPADVHERIALHYNQAKDVTKILLQENLTDEHAVYCALRLVYLIDLGKIEVEQAVAALDIACRTPLFVDEALYRLGLKKRTRLREPL
ncbi:MAG: hypothetical protein KGS72_06305 [Cyanobacteria bacterium REEB67]|nr:hypothetical protein [Cyanobacteria bacterium REEB67]